jgi:hypothetical protein
MKRFIMLFCVLGFLGECVLDSGLNVINHHNAALVASID